MFQKFTLSQLSLFDAEIISEPSSKDKNSDINTGIVTSYNESYDSDDVVNKEQDISPASQLTVESSGESSKALLIKAPVHDYDLTESFNELIKNYAFKLNLSARLKNSWRMEFRGKESVLHAPKVLDFAPCSIKNLLLEWGRLILKDGRTWTKTEREQKKQYEREIMEFISHADIYVNPEVKTSKDFARFKKRETKNFNMQMERLNAVGSFHNLEDILNMVNHRYFNDTVKAKITWSKKIGGLSTHSVHKDNKGEPYHLISISRGYDSADASPEIVGGVVYHECLHALVPPFYKNQRRVVHGTEFRKREREYPYYKEWMAWHRHQLPKKLRTLRWKKTMSRLKPKWLHG